MVIRQQLRHSNLLVFDSFWFPGDKIPRPDGSVDGRLRSRLESHPEDVPNYGSQGFGLNGIWWAFDNLPAQACSAECLFHCRPSPRILPQLECVLECAFDVFCLFILNRQHQVDALHQINHEWRFGHEASCQIHRRCGWSRDHQRALVDKRCHDVTGHPDMSSVEKVVVDLASFFAQKRALLLWQVLVPRRIQDHTRNQVEEGSCALVHFCVTGGTRNQGKFLCQEVFKTSPGVFFWSLVDPTSLNPAQGGLRDAMSGPKLGFLHGSRLHWIWKAYILFFAEATL